MASPNVIINEDFLLESSSDSSAVQSEQEEVNSEMEIVEGRHIPSLASQICINIRHVATDFKIASNCCIYRVPKRLREGNEIHYIPRMVSIGPYHYGDSKYDHMNKVKLHALDRLIKESSKTLQYFLENIGIHEPAVRACYSEEAVKLAGSDSFIQMMLVDAAFVVMFIDDVSCFDKYRLDKEKVQKSRSDISDIKNDLMLLENQLPLFLLEDVKRLFYSQQKVNTQIHSVSIETLSKFIWDLPSRMTCDERGLGGPAHLLDQLRSLYLPKDYYGGDANLDSDMSYTFIKSAKKLQESAIKIRAQNGQCKELAIFERSGKLKISPLHINDTSKTTYRNIMAFEKCHYKNEQPISDYIILMEMLIRDDSEEILVTNGVIVNRLSSDETATSFLRDLCMDVTYSTRIFRLGTLCKAVEKYCDRPAGKVRAALSALRIGGSILLILTLLQTIFSALALYLAWKPSSH